MLLSRKRATRRRGLLVLALLLTALAAMLGWWQSHARRIGAIAPFEQVLLEILVPAVRAAGALHNRLTPLSDNQKSAINPVILAQIQMLQYENIQLRKLLALQQTLPSAGLTAEVIGRDTEPWQAMLELGKGSSDGVQPHMVVLTPDGVLGQVLGVTPHTARVLLLTDSQSGIGAMTERTHAVGVLKGSNDGSCHLYYLSGQADVKPGDNVVTSGLSLIFPPGLPLGSVTAVTRNPSISSRVATVQPAGDPVDARLVLVIK